MFFNAEAAADEALLPQTYRIERVLPGREVLVSTSNPGEPEEWRLQVRLVDHGSGTEVRVAQSMPNLALAPSVAAGCEYYLDRMVADLSGGDPDDLDLDEYFVTQVEHYRRMFPVQRRPSRD